MAGGYRVINPPPSMDVFEKTLISRSNNIPKILVCHDRSVGRLNYGPAWFSFDRAVGNSFTVDLYPSISGFLTELARIGSHFEIG
jgi:hypothetical protein